MAVNTQIAPPINKHVLLNKDGNTEDIIKAVLWGDSQPEHASCTKDFAQKLRGSSDAQTIFNVWSYVKKNIRYILDPSGKQYIKSPAKTNADGFADCKSRSGMMASFLKNLGIPYTYRFASYTGSAPVTHVYVIAKPTTGGGFALDPDMDRFNKQKQTTYFIDKDMSEIHYVAGPGDKELKNIPDLMKEHKKNTPSIDMHRDPSEMTITDMEIWIRRNRQAINKHIIDGQKGAGSKKAEDIKDILDAYADAAHAMSQSDLDEDQKMSAVAIVMHDFKNGAYSSSSKLAGIGDLSSRNKSRQTVAHHRRALLVERAKKASEFIGAKHAKNPKGNILKRAAQGIKKGLKAVTHLAKSVANAPLKILLNVTLPKAADYFIYLFVKNPSIIAKMPDAARRKRKQSEVIAQFIIHTVGMKEDHFMGLIRNGIMKKHHMSPERVLQQSLHMNISGIGNMDEVGDIYTSIINIVISIIKDIAKIFKKPIPKEATDALSDSSAAPNIAQDFASASESDRKDFGTAVAQQPIAPEEKAASDPGFTPPTSDVLTSPSDNTTDDAAAVEQTIQESTPTDSRKTSAC